MIQKVTGAVDVDFSTILGDSVGLGGWGSWVWWDYGESKWSRRFRCWGVGGGGGGEFSEDLGS